MLGTSAFSTRMQFSVTTGVSPRLSSLLLASEQESARSPNCFEGAVHSIEYPAMGGGLFSLT